MTLPVNIRVNVSTPFPARVQGQGFISVVKANGVWTIAPNFSEINVVSTPNDTQYILLFDASTGAFSLIPALTLANLATGYRAVNASGSIVTQPTDGAILTNNISGGPINIILPASSAQNGLPITVKDIGGNAETYNITFVPHGAETIDGFSASTAAANGVAVIDVNYSKKTVYPMTSGGWFL